MTSVVYFVWAKHSNRIKIGRSRDLSARFSALRSASAEPLMLLGWIKAPNPAKAERELHERFDCLRSNGEWFRNDETLIDFIGRNAEPNDRHDLPDLGHWLAAQKIMDMVFGQRAPDVCDACP